MSAILMAAAMAVSTPAPAPAHTEVPPPPPPPPAPAAAEVPSPPAPPEATVHPVAPGESLSRIALCELGDADRWVEVFELNRGLVTDPDIIIEGWVLALPEPGTGDCPVPAPAPAVKASATSTSAKASKSSGASASSTSRATSTPAPRQVAATSQSGGGNLASIRQCESGGDYGAVSSSGKYRGAYQFDQQTWESVGGSGDPAAASAAEQDQRASALAQQRGSSPWPNCG